MREIKMNGKVYFSRQYSNTLSDMVDDGIVDKGRLIRDLINWMSEDDIRDFMIANQYVETDYEDEYDDEEDEE